MRYSARLLLLWPLLSLTLVSGERWRKNGIGRVTRVANLTHSPEVVVASEKGVISRLTTDSLQIVWRAPPVDDREVIDSIVLLEKSRPPVALVTLGVKSVSDDRTKAVRALNLHNGTVLWNVPGCNIGSFSAEKDFPYPGIIPIRSCLSGENIRLHQLADGEDVTILMPSSEELNADQESGSIPELSADALSSIVWYDESSGSGKSSPSGDLVWSDMGVREVEKENKVLELVSRSNGKLSLKTVGSRFDMTSRHEGMAHAIAANFFSSTTQKRTAPDILVTLSEFGTLFGFDLKKGGAVLWENEIDLNDRTLKKDNCKLIPGHANHIVVICTHGRELPSGHTTVAVVDGTSGGGLLGTYLHEFHTAHAFVHTECCSAHDTCVHLISNNGVDKFVSTCGDEYTENMIWSLLNPMYFSVSKSRTYVEGLHEGLIAWRFQLRPEMKIAQLAYERQSHPSARSIRKAAVRVTGDRKLLFKFADPGTLLVLTEPENNAPHQLTAVVIDGASGSVFKVMDHVNASRPYSAVRSDNWMAYSFWNTYLLQQELHVIDMYERDVDTSFIQERTKALAREFLSPVVRTLGWRSLPSFLVGDAICAGSVGNGVGAKCSAKLRNAAVSTTPELLHTAFLLSHQVAMMDVSETEGSITERSILFMLSTGQIVSLSRLAVDARRPLHASDLASEESVSQYYPYISLLATQGAGQYISGEEYLTGIQGVAVAPIPKQESSSHIAAFGTDLFYSKYAPAGNFDTLPRDFRFGIVIASVLLICVATYYSEHVLEAKELQAAW